MFERMSFEFRTFAFDRGVIEVFENFKWRLENEGKANLNFHSFRLQLWASNE